MLFIALVDGRLCQSFDAAARQRAVHTMLAKPRHFALPRTQNGSRSPCDYRTRTAMTTSIEFLPFVNAGSACAEVACCL